MTEMQSELFEASVKSISFMQTKKERKIKVPKSNPGRHHISDAGHIKLNQSKIQVHSIKCHK